MSAAPNSLGVARPPADTRVVVAMSGGVDSSVTAALLVAAGYQVVGVTLQLYDHGAATARPGACCAGQDIHDARRVADVLDIPHYVLDYESRFRAAVIEPFADAYARGETPIPCVTCNQTVKFRDLLATARTLAADALATGHYVRRVDGPDGPALHVPADRARDQSYFLFATTRDQLAMLRFPLGALTKDEVRAAAARFALPVAAKPDSRGICFAAGGGYARVVRRLHPDAAAPGEIVDLDGRVVGRHDGIAGFTVGQRRGLGIGARGRGDAPRYVVRLDPATRRVVVGPRAALGVARVHVGDTNWLAPIAAAGADVTVRLRSAMAPVAARVRPAGAGAVIDLAAPAEGVAPGQAAVCYDGDRVLGGGWIRRTEARPRAAA